MERGSVFALPPSLSVHARERMSYGVFVKESATASETGREGGGRGGGGEEGGREGGREAGEDEEGGGT